jgi:D-alanine transaminase
MQPDLFPLLQDPALQQAIASINGATMPLSEARIPALDRGFLFGDAVYEVLRVYRGRPWLFNEHMQRLAYSLGEIHLAGINLDRLRQRILQVLAQSGFAEAMVYIQITRGAAPRRHPFPAGAVPLELFYVQEFDDPYIEARRAGVQAMTFPDLRWQRCDIKSTNLLGNVLARQAAAERGCTEALFCRPDGTVSEGTHTSLFAVASGRLITPPRGTAILPGITRSTILSLAGRLQVATEERPLFQSQLRSFTELFVTGTTSEVLPVVAVDGAAIGNRQPGPITRRMQEAYREMVSGEY